MEESNRELHLKNKERRPNLPAAHAVEAEVPYPTSGPKKFTIRPKRTAEIGNVMTTSNLLHSWLTRVQSLKYVHCHGLIHYAAITKLKGRNVRFLFLKFLNHNNFYLINEYFILADDAGGELGSHLRGHVFKFAVMYVHLSIIRLNDIQKNILYSNKIIYIRYSNY